MLTASGLRPPASNNLAVPGDDGTDGRVWRRAAERMLSELQRPCHELCVLRKLVHRVAPTAHRVGPGNKKPEAFAPRAMADCTWFNTKDTHARFGRRDPAVLPGMPSSIRTIPSALESHQICTMLALAGFTADRELGISSLTLP